jgi:ParB-like chromosome segregation protein Spo0J
MSELTIKIHNAETNEVVEREMTIDEIAEHQQLQKNVLAKMQVDLQALAAKAALLDRLGITADEAKLLLA